MADSQTGGVTEIVGWMHCIETGDRSSRLSFFLFSLNPTGRIKFGFSKGWEYPNLKEVRKVERKTGSDKLGAILMKHREGGEGNGLECLVQEHTKTA